MTELRLHPSDPEVRRLTCAAIDASNKPNLRTLVARCAKCRAKLAKAAHTDAGPLFVSRWRVPVKLSPQGLTQRQQERFENETATSVSGHIDWDEHHGTYALLALPPTAPADYPDLLVRCERHGDALLDRLNVLDRLRNGDPEWDVDVGFPRHEYEAPDPSWLTDAESSRRRRPHRSVHYEA